MFKVYRNKHVLFRGTTFESYEKARQALRKYIRTNKQRLSTPMVGLGTGGFGMGGELSWDNISRNPTRYTDAGFRIRKAA